MAAFLGGGGGPTVRRWLPKWRRNHGHRVHRPPRRGRSPPPRPTMNSSGAGPSNNCHLFPGVGRARSCPRPLRNSGPSSNASANQASSSSRPMQIARDYSSPYATVAARSKGVGNLRSMISIGRVLIAPKTRSATAIDQPRGQNRPCRHDAPGTAENRRRIITSS